MLFRPRFDPIRPPTVPQEELSEAMACFQLIFFRRFPRPNQIA
jgi:hypothetical protein